MPEVNTIPVEVMEETEILLVRSVKGLSNSFKKWRFQALTRYFLPAAITTT